MADNTQLNLGTGGDTIGSDDIEWRRIVSAY
jgi:hypothetical protein